MTENKPTARETLDRTIDLRAQPAQALVFSVVGISGGILFSMIADVVFGGWGLDAGRVILFAAVGLLIGFCAAFAKSSKGI